MKKKRIIVIALGIIAAISAVVLCAFRGQEQTVDESPFGIFEIFDHAQETEQEAENEPTEQISFFGYGKCTVSARQSCIELKNPEGNTVNMVFTVSDKETGEVIARTTGVAPGKYAYVDVASFYPAGGTHCIDINTSTSDMRTGVRTNGMHQQMEVTIQ